MRPALAADLQRIAETLGRDEPGRGAAMLDQGIGGGGGAMAEVTDRRRRASRRLKLLRSSQLRVAKMEAGDPAVSLDLLIRSLLSLPAAARHSRFRAVTWTR